MKEEDKAKFLLEEYRQCYEILRNNSRATDNKEAIFAVAAFGIVALVIINDLSLIYTFGAALVSIFFYSYHVITCERIAFFSEVYHLRIGEIEKEIGNQRIICLEAKLKKHEEEKSNRHKKWYRERDTR